MSYNFQIDKLDILNKFYFQGKYSEEKHLNHSSQRIELVVRNKEKDHPSKYFLDGYTWKYKQLEELVPEKELQEFITNYLSKPFPKNCDPSYFVYETWDKKIFDGNKFESFSAVYFPQPIKTWETYKQVPKEKKISLTL